MVNIFRSKIKGVYSNSAQKQSTRTWMIQVKELHSQNTGRIKDEMTSHSKHSDNDRDDIIVHTEPENTNHVTLLPLAAGEPMALQHIDHVTDEEIMGDCSTVPMLGVSVGAVMCVVVAVTVIIVQYLCGGCQSGR